MAIDKIEGFQVVIPNEFLPVLQYLSEGESLDEVVRQSLAVSLFVERAVSMERAAAFSGLS
jgi:predicted HTH domain antitoxin